ncbi:hypothetical protein [uncultured Methylobacterium sp.]|uniref:hypothetical protein n=1 Tax=uncultured Methylobacterium sp. TaxID=157278 RepID=UPI0035CAD866
MKRKPGFMAVRAMHRECAAFNDRHAVGDTIKVWPGPIEGEPKAVQIRYPAQVLSGHTPVVYVTGGHGCIALSHVQREGR